MKTQKQRWWIIGGGLALTLAAIYLVQDPAEEVVVKSPTRIASLHSEKIVSSVQLGDSENSLLPNLTEKHLFKESKATSHDLFMGHVWYIPPPPPKPVVVKIEPPPPAAPPLPFSYIGKLENGPQGTQIFLSANDKVLSAWVGKNVDSVWRLDKEDANALTFTYLPLGLVKVLSKATHRPG